MTGLCAEAPCADERATACVLLIVNEKRKT